MESFECAIEHSVAGLPQDKDVVWTNLSQTKIAEKMREDGFCVSRYHVKKLLAFKRFKKRKLLKMKTLKDVECRDAQFERIANYRKAFSAMNLPVLSIDTKNKEKIGDFGRAGEAYSTGARKVNDHDFPSFAGEVIVPHGIYDVNDNTGYVTLGTSKDTSEFVCENIMRCWSEHLQYRYQDCETMLVLCDGGGSNASGHYIVKQDLVNLANKLNINIMVAHYPPYCSKWNPIEHRLFSQISHSWSGIPLTDIQLVKTLTEQTTTKTGLKVIATVVTKKYETKRKVNQDFKDNIHELIIFDDVCPKLNYLIKVK